MLIFNPLK